MGRYCHLHTLHLAKSVVCERSRTDTIKVGRYFVRYKLSNNKEHMSDIICNDNKWKLFKKNSPYIWTKIISVFFFKHVNCIWFLFLLFISTIIHLIPMTVKKGVDLPFSLSGRGLIYDIFSNIKKYITQNNKLFFLVILFFK